MKPIDIVQVKSEIAAGKIAVTVKGNDILLKDIQSGEAVKIATIHHPTEWISVKERLPEPGKRVLVVCGGFVGEAYKTSASTWYRYTGLPLRNCVPGEVTHWMELPEPPKAGIQ